MSDQEQPNLYYVYLARRWAESLVAHEMTVEEYDYHANKLKAKLEEETDESE